MTTTYITTGVPPQVQVTTGPGGPPVQTTFVTTAGSGVPPQTTYVEVIEDPNAQYTYSRWTSKHNAHVATLGEEKNILDNEIYTMNITHIVCIKLKKYYVSTRNISSII